MRTYTACCCDLNSAVIKSSKNNWLKHHKPNKIRLTSAHLIFCPPSVDFIYCYGDALLLHANICLFCAWIEWSTDCSFAQLFIFGRLPLLMSFTWKTIATLFIFFHFFSHLSDHFQTLIDLWKYDWNVCFYLKLIPLNIPLLCITFKYIFWKNVHFNYFRCIFNHHNINVWMNFVQSLSN